LNVFSKVETGCGLVPYLKAAGVPLSYESIMFYKKQLQKVGAATVKQRAVWLFEVEGAIKFFKNRQDRRVKKSIKFTTA
jgi:hypothetical protein